jgi:hypothetical protein
MGLLRLRLQRSVTFVATTVTLFIPKIDYTLAAAMLADGYDYDEIAPKVGAKSAESLRVCLQKRGITKSRLRPVTPVVTKSVTRNQKVQVSSNADDAVTDVLRSELNAELMAQVVKLRSKPVGELANRGQGRASVVKTIAESINVVFGVNVIHDAGDPAPIEVQAEVKPSEEST